jgi:nitrogen-specific signal transduction histidine kinase/CheY-like chemotaxis protein
MQVEIAERERTEAALHQAQKLQTVGQLAGGIAHDFNNMLATILGSLELMERRVAQSAQRWTDGDADRLRTLIERATGAVQRGAQLTSGLLAFSRRQRLSARPTDVNKLIAELVILAASTLGRRIRLVTELDPAPWPAQVNRSQVEAAILNLCLNARDAMPDGGTLTIRTSNVVTTAQAPGEDPPPGAYICVTVTDTGTGMTEDVQRRAFEAFFTTKGAGGSGMGLSQVQTMVRQAGGGVRLRSTPGTGTEITLLLPRAATEAGAERSPRSGGPSQQVLRATVVLVVDDDTAVRQVTVEMLRELGCDVVQAQSGLEALDVLAAGELPNLILLDYAMPGMNGLILARRIRDRGLTMPIAMITGYAELAEATEGVSPLDGLMRKPFSINDLQALLNRMRDRAGQSSNVVRLHVPQRG